MLEICAKLLRIELSHIRYIGNEIHRFSVGQCWYTS
jgi:hypothetical protein